MTARYDLEEKLEKLGQAIGSDESFVENIMSCINARPIGQAQRYNKLKVMKRFKIVTVVIAIALGCVIAANAVAGDKGRDKAIAYCFDAALDIAKEWILSGKDIPFRSQPLPGCVDGSGAQRAAENKYDIDFTAAPGFSGVVELATSYGSIKTDLPIVSKRLSCGHT